MFAHGLARIVADHVAGQAVVPSAPAAPVRIALPDGKLSRLRGADRFGPDNLVILCPYRLATSPEAIANGPRGARRPAGVSIQIRGADAPVGVGVVPGGTVLVLRPKA